MNTPSDNNNEITSSGGATAQADAQHGLCSREPRLVIRGETNNKTTQLENTQTDIALIDWFAFTVHLDDDVSTFRKLRLLLQDLFHIFQTFILHILLKP